jgi:hypothetical protein
MTDEENKEAKELLVEQLNKDVTLTLKQHEVVRLAQIVSAHLDKTDQYDYERSIWEKLVGVR